MQSSSVSNKQKLSWSGLIVVSGVLLCSLFYALSFVQIYSEEHVYKLASRWIYQNVKPGSKLLGVHWDDSLPVHLPGHSPRQYLFGGAQWTLPLYERDTLPKLKKITQQLAQADYIIFPTQRLPGSILRVPEEYIYTDPFLRLLFAEKLGYVLEKTVKVRPQLSSFVFDDDLADESFSVYDHPKVSIFKKVEQLSAPQIANRIIRWKEFQPLPSLRAVMQSNSDSVLNSSSTKRSLMLDVLLWFLVIELISFALFPILAAAFTNAPDKGLGLSKAFGLGLLGVVVWLSAFFFSIKITSANIFLVFVVLLVAAYVIFCFKWDTYKTFFKTYKEHIIPVELLFLGGVCLFAIFRAYKPEIFWGEKPMDFSFLNYLVRFENFPPEDPWAAGNTMHYYYFGTFLFALLHKLVGLSPGVGYNLAIATLAGFMLSAAYSVILIICKRRGYAVLGAVMLVLFSNMEVLRLLLFEAKKLNFDLYWASSRVLHSPGINEYPIWGLLFADLHAHLIALPFSYVLIALALYLVVQKKCAFSFDQLLHRILLGGALGLLFISNSWDFISYSGFLALCFFVVFVLRIFATTHEPRMLPQVMMFSIIEIALIAASAYLVTLPFVVYSVSNIKTHYNWVNEREFNGFWEFLRHMGHWFYVLLLACFVICIQTFKAAVSWLAKLKVYVLSLLLGIFPIFLGLASYYIQEKVLPWSILISAALVMFGGFQFLLQPESEFKRTKPKMLGILMIAGAVLVSVAELAFLNDRMNTLFKLYNAIWSLWGLAALAALPFLWRSLWQQKGYVVTTLACRGLMLSVWVLFAICVCGTILNIKVMTTFQRIAGPRPTLDGTAYLSMKDGDEAALIKWLNANITGTPVLLEAQGPSYRNFARISMNTGLPTVLGWEHHVYQRGTKRFQIEERRNAIKSIYNSVDLERSRKLLNEYNVSYIVVGNLERRTYTDKGLQKFKEHPEVFPLLFQHGFVRLYGVKPLLGEND